MRTVDARDVNSASLNTTPKIGQAEKDKTKTTSQHASPHATSKARRPSQEQRACSDPTPTPMLYLQLQPGYPTYYTGAQYAPVVVHMPPLVMHMPFTPQLQPQPQLQFAPTPTPAPIATPTRATSRPDHVAFCLACDVYGHHKCKTPVLGGPWQSHIFWVDTANLHPPMATPHPPISHLPIPPMPLIPPMPPMNNGHAGRCDCPLCPVWAPASHVRAARAPTALELRLRFGPGDFAFGSKLEEDKVQTAFAEHLGTTGADQAAAHG